jgi:hypothetical protein
MSYKVSMGVLGWEGENRKPLEETTPAILLSLSLKVRL